MVYINPREASDGRGVLDSLLSTLRDLGDDSWVVRAEHAFQAQDASQKPSLLGALNKLTQMVENDNGAVSAVCSDLLRILSTVVTACDEGEELIAACQLCDALLKHKISQPLACSEGLIPALRSTFEIADEMSQIHILQSFEHVVQFLTAVEAISMSFVLLTALMIISEKVSTVACRVLIALLDGRNLPASKLAESVDLVATLVSGLLARAPSYCKLSCLRVLAKCTESDVLGPDCINDDQLKILRDACDGDTPPAVITGVLQVLVHPSTSSSTSTRVGKAGLGSVCATVICATHNDGFTDVDFALACRVLMGIAMSDSKLAEALGSGDEITNCLTQHLSSARDEVTISDATNLPGSAAACLWALYWDTPRKIEQLLALKINLHLLDLISCEDKFTATNACELACTICEHVPSQRLLAHEGLIDAFLKAVAGPVQECKLSAARGLGHLSTWGGRKGLISLLSSPEADLEARAACMHALVAVVQQGSQQRVLTVEEGILGPMQEAMLVGIPSGKHASSEVASFLADEESLRDQIISSGCADSLVHLMRSSTMEETQVACCIAVERLVEHPHHCLPLCSSGAAEGACELVRHTNDSVLCAALSLCAALLRQSVSHTFMTTFDVLYSLKRVAWDVVDLEETRDGRDPQMRNIAASTLLSLQRCCEIGGFQLCVSAVLDEWQPPEVQDDDSDDGEWKPPPPPAELATEALTDPHALCAGVLLALQSQSKWREVVADSLSVDASALATLLTTLAGPAASLTY